MRVETVRFRIGWFKFGEPSRAFMIVSFFDHFYNIILIGFAYKYNCNQVQLYNVGIAEAHCQAGYEKLIRL